MRNIRNGFLSFLLLLLVASCATVGRDFNFHGPGSIVIGETTRKDINLLYGEPFRKGFDSDDPQWTYGYYYYTAFGDTRTKDLVVTFNEKGIVKRYTYNSSFD